MFPSKLVGRWGITAERMGGVSVRTTQYLHFHSTNPSKGAIGFGAVPQETASKTIFRVDRIWNKIDREHQEIETSKRIKKKDTKNKYTLVVRRHINEMGNVESTEVEIKSPKLLEVLRKIPCINKDTETFEPEALYHTAPALRKRKGEEESKENPDETIIQDINDVLRFVNQDFGPRIPSIDSLHRHGQITYEHLWTIFPPGCTIIDRSTTTNELQAYKVRKAEYILNPVPSYDIQAWLIHHDGKNFGWACETLRIPFFTGEKAITNCNVFPLHFHLEKESLQQRFLDRGKQFPTLIGPLLKDYEGMAVEEVIGFDNKPVENPFYVTGRVMIDPVAFRLRNSQKKLVGPGIGDQMEIDPKLLKPEDSLFCRSHVLGFSFQTKKWAAFDIKKLRDLTWDDTAMNKLIMDEKRRQLITALIKNHKGDNGAFDDIVRGKGKGLVGLLSGPPGVGKTLTAEVVAELSRRPLYAVTAGDLGTDTWDLDEKLDDIMSIVQRWGCVLLIDEADVYLRKRGDKVEQNALVSVFLRKLEYFQGIIILTTNRLQDIDEAFQSRIHFKFKYPPFNEKGRLAIWKTFLSNKLHADDLEKQNHALEKLAQKPLSGREIKNIVSCTVSISEYLGKTLTLETIEDVMSTLAGGEQ